MNPDRKAPPAPAGLGKAGRDRKAPPAPAGLGKAGRQLWRRVVADFETTTPAETALLEQACRSADMLARLEEAWATAPVIVPGSRSQPTSHPLIRELRDERAGLARLLAQLGLPAEGGSQWDGLSASQRSRKAAVARWSQ